MLTLAIGVIALVAISACAENGEWGSVAMGVIILLLLILTSAGERADRKAYVNRRNWWAYGTEPDWARRRNRGRR